MTLDTLSLSEIAAAIDVSIARKSIHRQLHKVALIRRNHPYRLESTAHRKEAKMTWSMSHCH